MGKHKTKRPPSAAKRCSICLYRTGLGCGLISFRVRRAKAVVARWIREAGIKDHERAKKTAIRNQKLGNEARQEWVNKRRAKRIHALKPTTQIEMRLKIKKTQEEIRSEARVNYLKRKHLIWERIKKNPTQRLRRQLRSRIWKVLIGNKKSAPTMELIGCSIKYARQHIESLWWPGMGWHNYGVHGWHVDHIMPCAAFDLSKPEQQAKAFHFSNLQPLWASDNLAKSDRTDWVPLKK